MRALLHGDLVAMARVLLCVRYEDRAALCDRIFDKAHAADKYRKKFGVYHSHLGSGHLASACHGLMQFPEPFLSDRDYADCMRIIFERVLSGPVIDRVRR
jgi:hypothetical protein